MKNLNTPTFQSMAESWPSTWIARSEVERFTGGIVTPKYLANLDCQGKGPEGRIRVGRKIAYKKNKFIEWLEKRVTVPKGD